MTKEQINDICKDIYDSVRKIEKVEMELGKVGDYEKVDKLIQVENLLTYCRSRLMDGE